MLPFSRVVKTAHAAAVRAPILPCCEGGPCSSRTCSQSPVLWKRPIEIFGNVNCKSYTTGIFIHFLLFVPGDFLPAVDSTQRGPHATFGTRQWGAVKVAAGSIQWELNPSTAQPQSQRSDQCTTGMVQSQLSNHYTTGMVQSQLSDHYTTGRGHILCEGFLLSSSTAVLIVSEQLRRSTSCMKNKRIINFSCLVRKSRSTNVCK